MENIDRLIKGLTILRKYVDKDSVYNVGALGDSIVVYLDINIDCTEDYNKLKDMDWWQDEELTGGLTWFWK